MLEVKRPETRCRVRPTLFADRNFVFVDLVTAARTLPDFSAVFKNFR